MVNDNVTSLASGLGSDNALGGNDLTGEGCLVLVDIDGDSGLIPVGIGLEEVLLGGKRGTESGLCGWGKCSRGSDAGGEAESKLHHSCTLKEYYEGGGPCSRCCILRGWVVH